jgi:hypothetical protein
MSCGLVAIGLLIAGVRPDCGRAYRRSGLDRHQLAASTLARTSTRPMIRSTRI